MLLTTAKRLVCGSTPIPADYQRMVRTEFRSVTIEFVEYFYKLNNRLPTMDELQLAI